MDGTHFDALTRSLAAPRSRRGLARLLGGLACGGPLALLGPAAIEAKKKGGKKGNGKKGNGKGKKRKPKPKLCTFDTCRNGCCQGGRCLPGTSNTACEKGGFPCENCWDKGEFCNENQSCQCAPRVCRARGNFCCFDGRCVADGELGVDCSCASEDEACDGNTPCCPGYQCVDFACCGLPGARCTGPANTCCDRARYHCEDGLCVPRGCEPPCEPGRMCCDGSCVLIGLNNCSGCGQRCPNGADRCVDGQCRCGNEFPCDCTRGAVCVEGRCVCNAFPGRKLCPAGPDPCAFYQEFIGQPCSNNDPSPCECPEGENTHFNHCPV